MITMDPVSPCRDIQEKLLPVGLMISTELMEDFLMGITVGHEIRLNQQIGITDLLKGLLIRKNLMKSWVGLQVDQDLMKDVKDLPMVGTEDL